MWFSNTRIGSLEIALRGWGDSTCVRQQSRGRTRNSSSKEEEGIMASRYLRYCLAGLGILSVLYLVATGLGQAGLHWPRRLLDDTLIGMVAGLGLYFFLQSRQTSRALNRRHRHEEQISQLNHHVRNALQLIVNHVELGIHSASPRRDIQTAVARIDWALREFLPSGASRAEAHLFTTSGPPGPLGAGPLRPPCPGVYPRYVPGDEHLTPDTSGPKLANRGKTIETSVSRNKSA